MGRITRRVSWPDGKLFVLGGYDPRCFRDYVEKGHSIEFEIFDVEPGDYRVDLYSFIHSVSGAELSSGLVEEDRDLWTWFGTSPGR